MVKTDDIKEWVDNLQDSTEDIDNLKEKYTDRYFKEDEGHYYNDIVKRHAFVDDLTSDLQEAMKSFNENVFHLGKGLLDVLEIQNNELSLLSTAVNSMSNRVLMSKAESGLKNQYVSTVVFTTPKEQKQTKTIQLSQPPSLDFDIQNNPYSKKTELLPDMLRNMNISFVDTQLVSSYELERNKNEPKETLNDIPPALPTVPKPSLPSIPKPKLSDLMSSSSSPMPSLPSVPSIPSAPVMPVPSIPSQPSSNVFDTPSMPIQPPTQPSKPSAPGGMKKAKVTRPIKKPAPPVVPTQPASAPVTSLPTPPPPVPPTPSVPLPTKPVHQLPRAPPPSRGIPPRAPPSIPPPRVKQAPPPPPAPLSRSMSSLNKPRPLMPNNKPTYESSHADW